MHSRTCYRFASVLLLLFAVGHTIGFLRFRPPTSEGLAVWASMNAVQFHIGGANFTYGGFYVGFGLFVTLYLLFSALLAWELGALSETHRDLLGAVPWGFFALQLGSFALSWRYFSIAPAGFSALVAVCVGWGAWQRSPRQAVRSMKAEPA